MTSYNLDRLKNRYSSGSGQFVLSVTWGIGVGGSLPYDSYVVTQALGR
ncbi:hypothetical protein [Anabaena sp. PCC 7108]|nr:hypothetical protein [Anabaena sp. PCC 7108]